MNTHFNYTLQVWVVDGKVKECGHPWTMQRQGCCNGFSYRGLEEKAALTLQKLDKG